MRPSPRYRLTAAAAFTAAVSLLAGCELLIPANTAGDDSPMVDPAAVIANFALPDMAVAPDDTRPALTRDPQRLRLYHAEPLELPPRDIVINSDAVLDRLSTSMAEQFYDEGYGGIIRQRQSSTAEGLAALCPETDGSDTEGSDGAKENTPLDIVTTHRAMTAAESARCRKAGVVPIAVQIGYDAIVVLTPPGNDWLTAVTPQTLAQLRGAQNWSRLSPRYPDRPLHLYGLIADEDTTAPDRHYRYILDMARDMADDPNAVAIASFGAVSTLKQSRLRVIPIGDTPPQRAGSAYPVKRPLYVVTSRNALKKPEVQVFIAHMLNQAPSVMPALGLMAQDGQPGRQARLDFIDTLSAFDPDHINVHEDAPR